MHTIGGTIDDDHPSRTAILATYNPTWRLTMTPETLLEIAYRLKMSSTQLADYLGVPVPTVRHWLNGTREMPPVAVRLLDVLATVETFNPDLHASFISKKAPKPRGRPVKDPV